MDCTDSAVHGSHRAVVFLSCLRFMFRPSIATVCHSDIYRATPTWVPQLPMLRFGGRRGCRGVELLRMGWLVHSPLTMRIWANSSARGWRRSGGLAWNSLIPVGDTWRVRVLLPSMTASIIRPAFKTFVIFHGPIPRSCSSLPPLPSHSTLNNILVENGVNY